jgi:hypothetical protein
MEDLKLVALDEEDLAVMSAHLQDSVLKASDLVWLPREHRFALAANRFDWENAQASSPRRRRTALHFDRVLRVQRQKLPLDKPETVLNLLAVTFTPTEAPSGFVTLVFSGGAAIRLQVECLEAQMKDLGPVWEAQGRPAHEPD